MLSNNFHDVASNSHSLNICQSDTRPPSFSLCCSRNSPFVFHETPATLGLCVSN